VRTEVARVHCTGKDNPRRRIGAMKQPEADRPFMPGYGTLGPDEGGGLLPWSWAEERLISSHDYWVSSRWPDGRPHLMPVWGVWHEGALWFSSSVGSRKAKNLAADPRCAIATDNALEPVVLEGTAERIVDRTALAGMLDVLNGKYDTNIGMDFLDPKENSCWAVRPTWVVSLTEDNFEGSPTRWLFSD
jgi:hypothetical protein